MIERVCDQHQLIKHSLNFILKKMELGQYNCILVNQVNLQNLGTLGVEQFPNRTSNNLKKKSGKSKLLMKRFLNFMRNPKLTHILVVNSILRCL